MKLAVLALWLCTGCAAERLLDRTQGSGTTACTMSNLCSLRKPVTLRINAAVRSGRMTDVGETM